MNEIIHRRLKKIAELSGVLGAILVLLAIIRVYVHYQYYNINIIPYLDFSEVILSIFNDLKVLFRLLVMLIGNVLLIPAIWWLASRFSGTLRHNVRLREDGDNEKGEANKREWILRISGPNQPKVRLVMGIIGVILISLAAFRFLGGWFKSVDDFTFYISSILLSIGFFIITWVIVNHFFRSAIFATIVLFFFIFILLGKHDPTLDYQNAQCERWTIVTEGDTISTNDSFYIAGRTSHYYFLYDINSKTTSIIPTSEVKFCSVRNIKSYNDRLRDIIKEHVY